MQCTGAQLSVKVSYACFHCIQCTFSKAIVVFAVSLAVSLSFEVCHFFAALKSPFYFSCVSASKHQYSVHVTPTLLHFSHHSYLWSTYAFGQVLLLCLMIVTADLEILFSLQHFEKGVWWFDKAREISPLALVVNHFFRTLFFMGPSFQLYLRYFFLL